MMDSCISVIFWLALKSHMYAVCVARNESNWSLSALNAANAASYNPQLVGSRKGEEGRGGARGYDVERHFSA